MVVKRGPVCAELQNTCVAYAHFFHDSDFSAGEELALENIHCASALFLLLPCPLPRQMGTLIVSLMGSRSPSKRLALKLSALPPSLDSPTSPTPLSITCSLDNASLTVFDDFVGLVSDGSMHMLATAQHTCTELPRSSIKWYVSATW